MDAAEGGNRPCHNAPVSCIVGGILEDMTLATANDSTDTDSAIPAILRGGSSGISLFAGAWDGGLVGRDWVVALSSVS